MPRGQNPDLETFLDMVFPWGPGSENLYKVVTWAFPSPEKPGEKVFANYAATGYDELEKLITLNAAKPNSDVYVCLGTTRAAMTEKVYANGKHGPMFKAFRQASNVVSHNTIFLDIDVGQKPDKDGVNQAYENQSDAYAALDDFISQYGLPDTSMEVWSGSGGMHVYWAFDNPLPPQEWLALSTALVNAAKEYGLKFDPQCTIDLARILRVPGTWNWKGGQRKPVQLVSDTTFTQYAYEDLATPLHAHFGKAATPIQGKPPVGQAGFQGTITGNFTAGVDDAPPISLAALAQGCPLIDDTWKRGGNGDPEPLWSLVLMAATFLDDPMQAAHELSQGDPRYLAADTEAKFTYKLTERVNRDLGWPKCETFSLHSNTCRTCPHFPDKKSPLNFAARPQPSNVLQFQSQPLPQGGAIPVSNVQWLPDGYELDQDYRVWQVWDEHGNPARTEMMVNCQVFDAAIGANGDLLFEYSVNSGLRRWGAVPIATSMQPKACAEKFAVNGVFFTPRNQRKGLEFAVAWITQLQRVSREVDTRHYGWTADGKGFTFDRTTYNEDGTTELAFRGTTHNANFVEKGELKPWQDAMQLIYGNHPLEAVVATSFAAPLMHLIANNSTVVSISSPKSGVGKTTALTLAQAVWGHPREGMSALSDTQNSVQEKIAALRNLPVYWDELRSADDMEQMTKLVFQITQGKGKSRLNADSSQRHAAAFTTMFAVASNQGIADSVYHGTEGTEAGGLRVFEFAPGPMIRGRFTTATSQSMLVSLNSNFGVAGARYAAFIAKNHKVLAAALKAVQDDYTAKLNMQVKERFWCMTMAAIKVGAIAANDAGIANFDTAQLDAFLQEALKSQRSLLKDQAHITMEDVDSGEMLLNDLMGELKSKNEVAFTDTIWFGQTGRATGIHLLPNQDPSRLNNVWMQVASNGMIRVKKGHFAKWCQDRRLAPKRARDLIEKSYRVLEGKTTLCAGVQHLEHISHAGGTRSICLDLIPVTALGSNPGSS